MVVLAGDVHLPRGGGGSSSYLASRCREGTALELGGESGSGEHFEDGIMKNQELRVVEFVSEVDQDQTGGEKGQMFTNKYRRRQARWAGLEEGRRRRLMLLLCGVVYEKFPIGSWQLAVWQFGQCDTRENSSPQSLVAAYSLGCCCGPAEEPPGRARRPDKLLGFRH